MDEELIEFDDFDGRIESVPIDMAACLQDAESRFAGQSAFCHALLKLYPGRFGRVESEIEISNETDWLLEKLCGWDQD